MSVNLLSIAQGAIGGPIMDQLGGILGEDNSKTESAIGASLPAILGGLMQSASDDDGLREINRMADEADGGILDDLGSMLSNNSGALLSIGGPLLAMLFGKKQDGLIGAIARMAGIGNGSAGSLLKLLIPVVMSLLGRQKKEQNLDERQLRSFLMDQRQSVADAIPAEVSDSIGFGDFLNQETRAAESVRPVDAPAQPAPSSGGLPKWLLPLVIVLGLGWLAYSYLGGGDAEIEAAQTMEMSKTLTDTLGGVATTIGDISDTDSATAAVERIKGASETIDGLGLDKLEGTAKSTVSGILGPLVTAINGALETAYKIPGVEAIVKPAIEPLLAKLSGI